MTFRLKSGNLVALRLGYDESGGDLVEIDGKKFKEFYGMSSTQAMIKHSKMSATHFNLLMLNAIKLAALPNIELPKGKVSFCHIAELFETAAWTF